MSAIDIRDLIVRRGGRAILDDVSLTIGAGAFVALVGPSGSGKTTLLKSINRLIAADEGAVLIDGRDTAAVPLPVLRHGIGYVIQSIGLFPHLTVAENINLVPKLTGSSEDRAAELLELVSLPAEMAVRYPRELSGGQQQRVGVARALAARPGLMLMDEPFGALDPITREELGRAYRALHGRLGLTTIMVTHDLGEALLLADRIVVLIEGRVRADAAPAALRQSDDPEVRALVETPLAQARRLAAL
ncbi:ATP-binding cassette domain-containing protein [Sphingosinicella sp.]|uniref:ATP-binding cassette domain-containing protein n=1 Tax=Sphingosinicella sp. TaxID=1917971 RepID=UPI004037CA23